MSEGRPSARPVRAFWARQFGGNIDNRDHTFCAAVSSLADALSVRKMDAAFVKASIRLSAVGLVIPKLLTGALDRWKENSSETLSFTLALEIACQLSIFTPQQVCATGARSNVCVLQLTNVFIAIER